MSFRSKLGRVDLRRINHKGEVFILGKEVGPTKLQKLTHCIWRTTILGQKLTGAFFYWYSYSKRSMIFKILYKVQFFRSDDEYSASNSYCLQSITIKELSIIETLLSQSNGWG